MRLRSVEKVVEGDIVRLNAVVDSETKGRDIQLWFEFDRRHADLVVEHADPFVPILLVPSMVYNETLVIDPPVSRKLYYSLDTPQSVLKAWFSELTIVEVKADELVERTGVAYDRTGCFFSGGVDSFYTFLKTRVSENPLRPRPSHLIMMHGYENPLETDKAGEFKRSLIEGVANEFGVEWIHGKANFRSTFDIKWGHYYHGAGLAAAAHCLSAGLHTFYVSSSFDWGHLFPWGSHPLLDPHWESEAITLIHDGCEATRVDKICRSLEYDDRFLNYLYVCMGKGKNNINCGGCNKCIRTMTVLAILGVLDRTPTFERKFFEGFDKKFTKKTLKKSHQVIVGELHLARESYELSKELGHPDERARKYLELFISRAQRRLFVTDLRRMVGR